MDERLKKAAVAIFQAVCSDPGASWETMSSEERDDALQWARAARVVFDRLPA